MTNSSRQEFFNQVNNYFDKVFVVTIPRLKERQAHMVKLLEGLDFEFVNGTDKENISPDSVGQLYDEKEHLSLSRFKRRLRLGELACALSHMAVYQQAVDQGLQRILILEDDITLVGDNLIHFSRFNESLPADWEMAYLGYWKNEKRPILAWVKQGFYILLSLLGIHKWSYKRHLNTYPKAVNDHVLKSGNHEGAYAYALTLDGCKKLLNFNTPIKLNADHLFSHLITNEYLQGYLTAHKFFEPMTKDGRKYFGSETDELVTS